MIDVSCLNRDSKVKGPRAGLGVHFPQSDFRDSSEKVFGLRTNNMAEEMACLRVRRQGYHARFLQPHSCTLLGLGWIPLDAAHREHQSRPRLRPHPVARTPRWRLRGHTPYFPLLLVVPTARGYGDACQDPHTGTHPLACACLWDAVCGSIRFFPRLCSPGQVSGDTDLIVGGLCTPLADRIQVHRPLPSLPDCSPVCIRPFA